MDDGYVSKHIQVANLLILSTYFAEVSATFHVAQKKKGTLFFYKLSLYLTSRDVTLLSVVVVCGTSRVFVARSDCETMCKAFPQSHVNDPSSG